MKVRHKEIFEAFIWTGGPDQTEDPEWFIKILQEGVFARFIGSNLYYTLHDYDRDGGLIEHDDTEILPGSYIIWEPSFDRRGRILVYSPETFTAWYEEVRP